MMRCPQCHANNLPAATECDTCGVVLAHTKRGAEGAQRSVETCHWSDHGHSCPCRGIISVGGPWYCREHYQTLTGITPAGTGNYHVQSTRSAYMDTWTPWYPEWLILCDRKLLPNPMPGLLEDEPA